MKLKIKKQCYYLECLLCNKNTSKNEIKINLILNKIVMFYTIEMINRMKISILKTRLFHLELQKTAMKTNNLNQSMIAQIKDIIKKINHVKFLLQKLNNKLYVRVIGVNLDENMSRNGSKYKPSKIKNEIQNEL